MELSSRSCLGEGSEGMGQCQRFFEEYFPPPAEGQEITAYCQELKAQGHLSSDEASMLKRSIKEQARGLQQQRRERKLARQERLFREP